MHRLDEPLFLKKKSYWKEMQTQDTFIVSLIADTKINLFTLLFKMRDH
jgi:hypothetical protein